MVLVGCVGVDWALRGVWTGVDEVDGVKLVLRYKKLRRRIFIC